MANELTAIRLWKIDDGEIHYVAARTMEEALPHVAAICDQTVEEYIEEYEPKVDLADYTKPLRINVLSEVSWNARKIMREYPSGARLVIEAHVEISPGDFDQLDPGLVCTTVD